MRRRWALAWVWAVALSAPVAAQDAGRDQTLADMRQELAVLTVELQKLTRELSTTGGAAAVLAGDLLQRVDLIEGEVKRLTAQTEELGFRIDRIVADGTNRIGDLEFRICEIEPGCDIANLPVTAPLGGEAAPNLAAPAPQRPAATIELAVGEEADFQRARTALDQGNPAAAEMFQAFADTYPGSPLTAEAHYLRGQSLNAQGRTSQAARAYLQSFSSAPAGSQAPGALLGLGVALGVLGQTHEACMTLGEVGNRFPGGFEAAQAAQAQTGLGCS